MKTRLKISILVNLGLLGVLIYFWANQRRVEPAAALPAGSLQPVVAVSAPPIVQQAEPKPFRWSQLVSTNDDYRLFVANLRALGCPELTVEDIVRGDAERVFFAKRRQLQLEGSDPVPGRRSRRCKWWLSFWVKRLPRRRKWPSPRLNLPRLNAECVHHRSSRSRCRSPCRALTRLR